MFYVFLLSQRQKKTLTYPHDPVHRVRFHRPHPPAHALERPPVADVVDEQDPHRAAVVRGGDGAEALLAGGVPDLELDRLAVEEDLFDLEVDSGVRFLFVRLFGGVVVGVGEGAAR